MKRIIVTENQARLIIDNLISEQGTSQINVKTVYGGTDGQRVSHAFLEKTYGLPGGSKNENYYYGANIEDVIKISANPQNTSKFLSVFTLNDKYSNNTKDFYDYIEVNGQSLDQPGSKVFKFAKGTVYASHNGLLGLVRAMTTMGGVASNVKISFGASKKGPEAENERMVGSVTFNSNQALNKTPAMNLFTDGFASLSADPNLLKNTISVFKNYTVDQLKVYLPKRVNETIMGIGGFMDYDQKDSIIKILQPKGFITDLKYDLNPVMDQLIKLKNIPDTERADDSNKMEYNEGKRNQLNNISKTFLMDFVEKVKAAYIYNFKLYVEHFLPEDKDTILPLIPNTQFKIYPIGEWHHTIFHARYVGSAQTGSQLQQQNKKVGVGGIN